MKGDGNWIDAYGNILDLSGRHINQVIDHPEKFGFSNEDIKAIFRKHGESLNIDGSAREDIIKDLMQKGFIHIRLFTNKFWAINLWEYNSRTKKVLMRWAEKAKDNRWAGLGMSVRITDFKNNETISTTVQDLYYGELKEDDDSLNPKFVSSVESFGNVHRHTFIEYLTDKKITKTCAILLMIRGAMVGTKP